MAVSIGRFVRSFRPPPKLYLRSLSTQKPHPKAREPFIDLAAYGVLWVAFSPRLKMQISGDFLRVTVYRRVVIIEAILVWHWPTGTINAVSRRFMHQLCATTAN